MIAREVVSSLCGVCLLVNEITVQYKPSVMKDGRLMTYLD